MDFATQVKQRILDLEFKPIVIEKQTAHEQMLKRSRRYREKHLEQCRKKSSNYDKLHPEQRRERWRRWKQKHSQPKEEQP